MKYSWLFGMERQTEMNHNIKECLKRKMDTPLMNENSSVSTSTKKIKRYRSAFTTEQVNYLEMEFKKFAYIGSIRRRELSVLLGIPERAIKIWFQNKRMKEKKDANKVYEDDQYNLQIDKSTDDITTRQLINDCELSTNHRNETSSLAQERTNVANESADNIIDMSTKPSDANLKNLKLFPPIINSNQTSTDSTKFSVESLKKYNENNKYAKNIKKELVTNPHEKMKSIDDRHLVSSSSQNVVFEPHVPISFLPQDLTSKANLQIQHSANSCANSSVSNTVNPTITALSSTQRPLYLNNVYAQPYLPPGNMIWKPVNATPIMSTGLPGVYENNIATSSVPRLPGVSLFTSNIMQNDPLQARILKPKCNCDCHEKSTSPVILQHANAVPQLQYVITALPFQNGPTFGN